MSAPLCCCVCGRSLEGASAYYRNFDNDTARCEDCPPPPSTGVTHEWIRRVTPVLEWKANPKGRKF